MFTLVLGIIRWSMGKPRSRLRILHRLMETRIRMRKDHLSTFRLTGLYLSVILSRICGAGTLNGSGFHREYKEALRLQRAQSDVYRSRVPGEAYHSTLSPTSYENLKLDDELKASQYNESQQNNKKPIQKVIPSRNTNYTNSYTNGDSSYIPSYIKPSSPVKTSTTTVTGGISRPSYSSYQNSGSAASRLRVNSGSPRPLKWNNDIPPDKLSFTMRREFEKAKEEAELIEQLRNVSVLCILFICRVVCDLPIINSEKLVSSLQHIETRLKMSLPEDIGPALMDGVVLCHLANHVRPRSVASIHVPSPAVVSTRTF